MNEKDPARFEEPDKEEKPIPADKNCYCVHCFQDKPESSMSVVDDCCQACLDRAFSRDDRWDIIMSSLRKWVDSGLEGKEDKTVVLSRIKTYLKGR